WGIRFVDLSSPPFNSRIPLQPASVGALWGELTGHALDTMNERRQEHLGRRTDADVRQPMQQLIEQYRDLAAREICPEAKVRAARAEADMLIGLAHDIEAVRLGEHRVVAVGGVVP